MIKLGVYLILFPGMIVALFFVVYFFFAALGAIFS